MPEDCEEFIGTVFEVGPVIGTVGGGSWQVYVLTPLENEKRKVAIPLRTLIKDGDRERRIRLHDQVGGEWKELSSYDRLPGDLKQEGVEGILINVRNMGEERRAAVKRDQEARRKRATFQVVI